MVATSNEKPGRSSVKYKPVHGREFDAIDVPLLEALDKYHTSRTRDGITYLALGSAIGALALAAIFGAVTGRFSGLEHVWSVAGPIVTGIIGYYFHRSRKDLG